jgi:hypothetical protein
MTVGIRPGPRTGLRPAPDPRSSPGVPVRVDAQTRVVNRGRASPLCLPRSALVGMSPSPVSLAEHRVLFGVGQELPDLLRAAAADGDLGSPRQRLLACGHVDDREPANDFLGLRVRPVSDRPVRGHDARPDAACTTCSTRPGPKPNAPGPTSSARRPCKPCEPHYRLRPQPRTGRSHHTGPAPLHLTTPDEPGQRGSPKSSAHLVEGTGRWPRSWWAAATWGRIAATAEGAGA